MTRWTWRHQIVTAVLIFGVDSALAQSGSLTVDADGISARSGTGSVSGRRYDARQGQSHEVVLPDGTTVVIGAGGSVTAMRFEWDGNEGAGRLRLAPGTYRISSGALGRSGDLEVFAGNTRITIEDATAVISVDASDTASAYMAIGGRVNVSAGGRCTRRLSRAGFVTTANAGGCPSRAVRVSGSTIAQDRRALRPTVRAVAANAARSNSEEDRGLFVPASGQIADDAGPVGQASRADNILGDSLSNARNEQTSEGPTTGGPTTGGPTTGGPTTGGPTIPRGPGPGLGDNVVLALSYAPGIDVPGASSVNVSGTTGSQADGRFTIFGDSSEPDLRSYVIFPGTSATDVFFSNTDAEPVESAVRGRGVDSLGYTSSDFENLFRIGQYGLASSDEVSGDFTVRDAIDLGLGPNQGFEDYSALVNDEDSGVFEDDVIGRDFDTAYHAAPQFSGTDSEFDRVFSLNLGSSGNDPLPFGTGLVASFSSAADDSQNENTFDARDAFQVDDAFVLYHFAERDGASLYDIERSYVFATGTTAETSPALRNFRIDRFETSLGLFDLIDGDSDQPRRALLSDASRARYLFSSPDERIALSDPGVYFVYDAQDTDSPTGTVAQVAHGDLGFSGTGSEQFSTLSISTGRVDRSEYQASTIYPNPNFDNSQEESDSNRRLIEDPLSRSNYSVVIESLGSRRDNPADPRDRDDGEYVASEIIYSSLDSTSYGGGNPEQRIAPDTPLQGVAGYFVLEGGGDATPLDPGDASERFQTVRLLRGTGSVHESSTGTFAQNGSAPPEFDATKRDTKAIFFGYAAGLAEFPSDAGTVGLTQRGAGAEGSRNLRIVTDPAANRLAARVTLRGRDDFSSTFELGGSGNNSTALSAYVDRSRFGALSSEGNFALASSAFVLGQTVQIDGQSGRRVTGLGSDEGTFVRDYAHVKWGVFLGDRIPVSTDNNEGRIDIGTWVAGDPIEVSQYKDFTGTATYTGHAIGNAFDGTATYTAIGSYTNSWTFNGTKSAGSVEMTFDNSTYVGSTKLKSGGGFDSTNLKAPGRVGSLNGDFFGGVSNNAKGKSPNALGGQFDLSNAPNADTYRASGTFAAEK